LPCCVGGYSSSKPHIATTPYERLGIKNTTPVKPTPQIPSIEGKDWVLVLRSFHSKKLLNKRRLAGMKSLSKFNVVEGQVAG
jgi:hypothetical protein